MDKAMRERERESKRQKKMCFFALAFVEASCNTLL